MSYKTLYRELRPQIFEDIIGQDQTVTILKNQIKNSNISHAYLFAGIRGTGKTSTARIFARAVNCINPDGANPCNKCEICRGILMESVMDVIEIDAASNRGIDDIRELREHTKYNPSRGKYKIYIIDEAHRLTPDAFNALLKTLEEPLPHVIFILATTEPHELPVTILSRCQRFDFKPIKTKDIINQLSVICKKESIDCEEEALRLIAINSEGALRDALSILDKCISFNNETLRYDDVIEILGTVNYEAIFNLVDGIAKKDTSGVLTLVNEIFVEGRDAGQLMKDLIFHFRNLLFVKTGVEVEETLVLSEERLKQFKEQGKLFDVDQISSFIYTLSDFESRLKYSSQPRILMEIAVSNLCNRELNDSLEGIIKRVKQLEKIIASGKIKVDRGHEKTPQDRTEKIRAGKPFHQDKKQGIKKSAGIKPSDEHTDKWKKQKDKRRDDRKPSKKKQHRDDSTPDINSIKNIWGQVLDQMQRDKKAPIKALLKEGTLEQLDGDTLIISFKEGSEFHRDKLDKEDVIEYVSNTISKFIDKDIRPSFIMEDKLGVSQNTNEQNTKEQKDPVEKLQEILPEEIFNKVDIIDE